MNQNFHQILIQIIRLVYTLHIKILSIIEFFNVKSKWSILTSYYYEIYEYPTSISRHLENHFKLRFFVGSLSFQVIRYDESAHNLSPKVEESSK